MKKIKTVDLPRALKRRIRSESMTTTFSILKVTEGGIGQKLAIQRLRDEGIPAGRAESPYIGQTAVKVAAKHAARAQRILYGGRY